MITFNLYPNNSRKALLIISVEEPYVSDDKSIETIGTVLSTGSLSHLGKDSRNKGIFLILKTIMSNPNVKLVPASVRDVGFGKLSKLDNKLFFNLIVGQTLKTISKATEPADNISANEYVQLLRGKQEVFGFTINAC
jgi:hypothetical protein